LLPFYGQVSLFNCVTVAEFPATPFSTTTVVAVFLESVREV